MNSKWDDLRKSKEKHTLDLVEFLNKHNNSHYQSVNVRSLNSTQGNMR